MRVTGLTGSRYKLSIDGQEVGTFTAAELGEGVNLALLPTPMLKQSLAVHTLTQRHNHVHGVRWREVQLPLGGEETSVSMPRALSALDAVEAEVVQRQRAAAQPKPHTYMLMPL